MITNAKKNPNFSTTVKYLDIELPEQVRQYFFYFFSFPGTGRSAFI